MTRLLFYEIFADKPQLFARHIFFDFDTDFDFNPGSNLSLSES